MHQPDTVGDPQPLGDLPRVIQGLGHGQPAIALQTLLQALAAQQLHHQERTAGTLSDLVDGDDVIVLQ